MHNSIFIFLPQALKDSLDFHLRSVYDHHNDFFWGKNRMLYQKETVSEDQRWVFVNLSLWQYNFPLLAVAFQLLKRWTF